MPTEALTEQQAMAAYRAIVARYHEWEVQPHDEVVQQGIGPRWPTGPVLVRDFDWAAPTAPWAIAWEEGPFEWALDASQTTDDLPAGVYVEPVNGWSLALYPA